MFDNHVVIDVYARVLDEGKIIIVIADADNHLSWFIALFNQYLDPTLNASSECIVEAFIYGHQR